MGSLISSVSNDVMILDFEETKILDQKTVDDIGGDLQKIAKSTEMKKIVVDMNRIELMTSTMIGQFVTFNRECNERGIEVHFCNLTSSIKDLFKITKLDSVFKIMENREKAIDGFGG